MYNLLRNKVLIGVILYIVPFAVTFLIFRLFSWIVEPSYSIENAVYAYVIYMVLLLASFTSSFFVAKSRKVRGWGLRFFFALIAIFQFIPVMFLAVIGAGSIYLNDVIAEIAPISLYYRIKYSKFGCTVTSILAAVASFALMLFVIEKGNVKTSRRINKAVFVVHHLGSGDYFIAALLALLNNWRVMIGANLWKFKIFHWFFNAVGIPIERENTEEGHIKRVKAVLASKDFLIKNKNSRLVVFAKGTREREPEKGVYGLKMGAFKIAHELGLPIICIVIVGTNKWRKPWTQDTSTHKGKKYNIFTLFGSYIYQFFKTGITPTIVTVIHCNPISTVGKTLEEVRDEAESLMHRTYIAYTTGKGKDRKKILKGGVV